jgi:hypothetical protein
MRKLEDIFLIYADDFMTWNPKTEDWNHTETFRGTEADANDYARKKYGKKYIIHRKKKLT